MNSIIYSVIAIIGIFIIFKLLKWPIKIMTKLLINGILGVILLIIVNFVGKTFGIYIAINAVTALIAGFLGVPGVLFLIVYNILM